ncbi:MAG: ABC transporter ATP-binding protein [Oligoflexia bacterium]
MNAPREAHPLLELKKISHAFCGPSPNLLANGSLEILKDLELSVYPGERVAILGPSGSGKSTLLSLMAGLQRPSSGVVKWRGQVISQLSERQLSRLRPKTVALVFQQFLLIPHLTALENVSLPLELQGKSSQEASALAFQALEKLGLKDRLDHFPRMLSGGECQRVAIARALVVSPELLLADEPTGNLDPMTAEQVFELLIQLPRSHLVGALVLVTHNEELARRCDRRLRLEGRTLREEP